MQRGSPGAAGWVVFLLCSLGVISNWVVLYAVFFRAGVYTVSAIAGAYITLLEASWALGMIYGMDPAFFPKAFCTFQAIGISCGAYGLSTAASCLSLSVFLNLRAPPHKRPANPLTITGKLVPVFILYPAVCTAIFAVVAIRKDAIGPSWVICDAVDPPWVRALSYAGMDWLIITPACVFSVLTIRRLLRMRRELSLSISRRNAAGAVPSTSSASSPVPTQASYIPPTPHVGVGCALAAPASPAWHQVPLPATPSTPGSAPPDYPGSPGRDRHLSNHTLRTLASQQEEDEGADVKSVSPSLLSTPQQPLNPTSALRRPQGISQRILEYEGLDRIVWGGREIRPAASFYAEREAAQRAAVAIGVAGAADSDTSDAPVRLEDSQSQVTEADEEESRARDAKHAFDAILRVVVLTLVCLITQALASISPFIAIGRNRVDRGFGTQHLAGFLAAAFAAPIVMGATPAFHAWLTGVWTRLRARHRQRRER